MNKKVIVFGTRPEFIKLLPVIVEIKRQHLDNDYLYIYTGQHTDLINDLFEIFSFKPTYTLQLKNQGNSLSYSFSHILSGIQKFIEVIKNDFEISIIIGQGDTTSCVCAALSAFFNHIPFGHIEAGLRTNNIANPFPEELFRKIISLTSTINFAPTIKAKEILLKEGVKKENILVTGNTIVDAMEMLRPLVSSKVTENSVVGRFGSKNIVLITCHRRENQNEKYLELIDSIKRFATEYKSLQFVWISHVTPFVKKQLTIDQFHGFNNIHILPPINVFELFSIYEKTRVIITDSGGIQEEAPSFDIPVIVIRDYTERFESAEMGYSVIIGLNREKLMSSFNKIINQHPVKMINPYGNGHAAHLILSHLNEIH